MVTGEAAGSKASWALLIKTHLKVINNYVEKLELKGFRYFCIYKLDHFIFQRLMAYKLFLVGVDNVLQSSVPVCYLLAADLEN